MNRYTTTFEGIENGNYIFTLNFYDKFNIINEPLFGESFDNDEELLYSGWAFGLIINYSHKTTVIDITATTLKLEVEILNTYQGSLLKQYVKTHNLLWYLDKFKIRPRVSGGKVCNFDILYPKNFIKSHSNQLHYVDFSYTDKTDLTDDEKLLLL